MWWLGCDNASAACFSAVADVNVCGITSFEVGGCGGWVVTMLVLLMITMGVGAHVSLLHARAQVSWDGPSVGNGIHSDGAQDARLLWRPRCRPKPILQTEALHPLPCKDSWR